LIDLIVERKDLKQMIAQIIHFGVNKN